MVRPGRQTLLEAGERFGRPGEVEQADAQPQQALVEPRVLDGDGSLIGIQAVVLNNAVIGRNCLVGAGALVTEPATLLIETV